MKRILITGANSYIGTSFENYIKENFADKYTVDTVDMIDGSWREKDFSGYDTVFHVAGIAHADTGKISEERKQLYYKVNTDLTVETAKKAKADGVKQFIFMSSAIVYGDSAPIGKKKVITKDTPVSPANCYGDSKVQAEKGILPLDDDSFKVVILRPPMIYGKGSKGNYPQLSRFAQKLPFFPYVKNERSMLYIGNLVEFVSLMVENEENGVFFPQNAQYTSTSEMVKLIAEAHGKKIRLIKGVTWLLKLLSHITGLVNKAFGNLSYDMVLSEYKENYRLYSLEESVRETEAKPNIKGPRALMLSSVASMIDQFNTENIGILRNLGYIVDVAANFQYGSITSQERVDEYKSELLESGIQVFDILIPRSIIKIRDILSSYKKIKALVLTNHYDIVHCHSPIGGVLCRLACKKNRKNGTKVIYTAHGFHFYKGASWKNWMVFYPIERLCSRNTDVLITINQEDYKRAQKFKASRVELVNGIGINVKKFRDLICDKKLVRAQFGFSDDDYVVMSVGQLSVRKNQETIIRALGEINNQQIKYLIVGFGELEDKLKKLVSELGLEKRIVFAGYRGDVAILLHAVDAFVFPSLQEGLPVSLMEAMAAGLPIVCSKIRGNIDLIEDGKGGYLFNIRDVNGFAAGITRLAEHNNTQMSEINLKTIMNFDISIVNKQMLQIYSDLMNN